MRLHMFRSPGRTYIIHNYTVLYKIMFSDVSKLSKLLVDLLHGLVSLALYIALI